MDSEVKNNIKLMLISLAVFFLGIYLTGCSTTTDILSGSTHACGNIHAEGYFTDTQGEIVVVKVPDGWTAEEIRAFCGQI